MSSPPTSVTAAAALDAVQPAVDHTRRHLFPFRFERWVALGLVAFLDQCGRGGGGFNIPGPGGLGDTEGTRAEVESGLAWLAAHVVLVSLLAAVVLALAVAISALVLWINSRGVFMYIDDVASGRSDVARPWREHARHASSYFAWSFGLAMATMTAALLLVLAMGGVALVMIRGRSPVVVAGVATIVGLVLLLLAIVLGCCTCCFAFLPVVSQTILQPAYYFERAWPLYLLRQLGHDLLAPPGAVAVSPSPEVP